METTHRHCGSQSHSVAAKVGEVALVGPLSLLLCRAGLDCMSKLAFTESPCPPSQPGPLNRSPSVSVGIKSEPIDAQTIHHRFVGGSLRRYPIGAVSDRRP